MKSILLATQNESKTKVLTELITNICGSFEFTTLKELGILDEVQEEGTIQNRAQIKS